MPRTQKRKEENPFDLLIIGTANHRTARSRWECSWQLFPSLVAEGIPSCWASSGKEQHLSMCSSGPPFAVGFDQPLHVFSHHARHAIHDQHSRSGCRTCCRCLSDVYERILSVLYPRADPTRVEKPWGV